MFENPVDVAVIPGAGSSGLAWRRVADLVETRILPVASTGSVPEMADALVPELADNHQPRVLVGASLGAVVALELMDRVRVDVAVLVATGLGIAVDEQVLERVRNSGEEILTRIARSSLAAPSDEESFSIAVADLRSRGHAVLVRHLSALAAHQATVPATVPETFVVWGQGDRSVPLADHLVLARALNGLLVPVPGAGHLPFLENPRRMAEIIKLAIGRARAIPLATQEGEVGAGTGGTGRREMP